MFAFYFNFFFYALLIQFYFSMLDTIKLLNKYLSVHPTSALFLEQHCPLRKNCFALLTVLQKVLAKPTGFH